MLKNRYQEIIVGMNLMSLIRGLISLKRNHSTLVIDDQRFSWESYPALYLSELEVLALTRLGNKHEIPELIDVRQFLIPASVEFSSDRYRLRLGSNPFENLRELVRKFPELIDKEDLDLLYAEGPEGLNQSLLSEMKRYECFTFEAAQRPKGVKFEFQGPKWFKTAFTRFGEMLNAEYSQSKDLKYSSLLHLLGVLSEEKLKTKIGPEEIPFYFFRMLSPLYRLQDYFLTTQLKRRLNLLGGDYKQSQVQYWQLDEDKFENLLLESFEGVISGERVMFFSHLPEEVPFHVKSPFPIFRKTQVSPVKRINSPYPPYDLTFMTHSELLGSEKPYRVYAKGKETFSYQWPYPELPGSKAQFYDRPLLSDFEADARILPFEQKGGTSQNHQGVSLDMRQNRSVRKNESPILSKLPMEMVGQSTAIQGFEYWGPFRYRTLGFLALCYGVEGN